MKKIVISILFVVFALISGYAQVNFDKRLVKEPNCDDIRLSSTKLFQDYFENNQLDSAKLLLDYWSDKCGKTYSVLSAKLLLDFKNGLGLSKVKDDIESYLDVILVYRNIIRFSKSKEYSLNRAGRNNENIRFFTDFVSKEMKKYQQEYENYSDESVFIDVIGNSNDSILFKIQEPGYEKTEVFREHQKLIQENLAKPEFNIAFISGVWVPKSDLEILGVHPEIGFLVGVKQKRWSYDLDMYFKFGKSDEPYNVVGIHDTIELTNHFFGGFIGGTVGWDIIQKKRIELRVLGGIAFDGFDAIKSEPNKDIDGVSVNALNLNLGVGFRYFLNNSIYLETRVKHNFVDYTKSNKVDLKGNTTSIQLLFGGLSSVFRNRNLKNLDYNGFRYNNKPVNQNNYRWYY